MTPRETDALRAIARQVHVDELPEQLDADAEQANILATITIPYDPRTGRVTHGPHKGRDAAAAAVDAAYNLRHTGRLIHVRIITIRPWYRLWQPTPAYQVKPFHYSREAAP